MSAPMSDAYSSRAAVSRPIAGRRSRPARLPLTAVTVTLLLCAPALALEEGAKEKENLDACEKSLCELLVKRDAGGGDLKCDLAKTWGKDKIKAGIEGKKLGWSMGERQTSSKQRVHETVATPNGATRQRLSRHRNTRRISHKPRPRAASVSRHPPASSPALLIRLVRERRVTLDRR